MKALNKKIKFEVPLTLKSGLHIGGSNLSMAIGGADAVVIRDPVTQEPIIPGSSLKGKMRSMTEKLLGAFGNQKMGVVKVGPYQDTTDKVKKIIPELYGRAMGNDENIPSRLIVRDARLDENTIDSLKKAESTDMLYTEVKTEVVIDRVTSAAMPRQLERVPAGSVFHMEMVLNVFEEEDQEDRLINYVKVGLRLMEDDYIGGKGSRGSGEVSIDWDQLKMYEKTLSDYEQGNDWKQIEE